MPAVTDPRTLAVDPDALARRLGIATPVVDPPLRQRLLDAIADAQADVEGYLGRVVTPIQVTDTGRYEYADGWRLSQHPVVEIVSVTPETGPSGPTGSFTVVYLAGLDAANDPQLTPIRRYILAQASEADAVRALMPDPQLGRRVTSLSAEGQSVSYEAGNRGGGTSLETAHAGDSPALASLDRWKLAGRRVSSPSWQRWRNGPFAPYGVGQTPPDWWWG